MSSRAPTVAIVDDDAGVGRALARLFRSLGFEASVHGSGEALLAAADAALPDHVLLDLHLPGLRGPDLIAALAAHGVAPARVVVMTGLDRPGAREACLRAGVAAYTLKPVHLSDIVGFFGLPDAT